MSAQAMRTLLKRLYTASERVAKKHHSYHYPRKPNDISQFTESELEVAIRTNISFLEAPEYGYIMFRDAKKNS